MSGILDWMDEVVSAFWDKISDLLPADPFTKYIHQLSTGAIAEYIGYINYFFPVGFFLKCFSAFLASLAIYYTVVVVMRWIKAVS